MVLYLILFGVITLVYGQPQYEVQLQHTDLSPSFSYQSGKENQLADGSCCVSGEIPPCTSPCSLTRINLCFREAQHPMDDSNLLNCPLGRQTFDPNVTNQIVTFSLMPSLTTTTIYPGSYQLLFEISAIQPTRQIDSGIRTFAHTLSNRTSDMFISTPVLGMSNVAILNLGRLRVVCREGYFGPDCGCSPRNDSTGHFTCAADGTIVCLPGYQNPDTNCTEEEVVTEDPTTMETTEGTSTAISSTEMPSVSTPMATSTTMSTEPSPTSPSILPIAVGAAIGGLVVIVLIVILIIVVVLVCRSKKIKGEERGVVLTTLKPGTPEDNGGTTDPLYSAVNKSAKSKDTNEEAPPIVPYQGDLYTEVEKTGLFAKKEDTKDTQYTTVPKESNEETYSSVHGNGYSEVKAAREPQIVYADVSVSGTIMLKAEAQQKAQTNEYGNIHKTDVQYSQIQTQQI